MIYHILGIILTILSLPLYSFIKGKLQEKLKSVVSACMVVTEQEGALIFINGKSTGKRTPSLVSIPKGEEVEIQLKKEGYLDHFARIRSRHELTFYHCQLTKFKLQLAVTNEDSMGR